MRKYKTLIIILLIILFTNCISVYATYTYFAKDISYTKKRWFNHKCRISS